MGLVGRQLQHRGALHVQAAQPARHLQVGCCCGSRSWVQATWLLLLRVRVLLCDWSSQYCPARRCRCYDNGSYTKHRYCINTTKSTFSEAQGSCNLIGGHLVAYQDMTEQRDVEMWFQDQGYLLPNFHKFYWMGLMTGACPALPDLQLPPLAVQCLLGTACPASPCAKLLLSRTNTRPRCHCRGVRCQVAQLHLDQH
jgi:hypothetical protein